MKTMRRLFFALIMMSLLLTLGGCGDDWDDHDENVEITLDSDPGVDGYIRESADGSSRTLTVGANTLLAGVHPVSGDEYRAFLDFPIVGLSTNVDYAFLEIFIRSYQSQGTSFPLLIELVDFDPPLLLSDFDRSILLPLVSTAVTIRTSDVNRVVSIDVTPLLKEAQRLGLPSFQVRLLQDLGPGLAGLIGIDDSDNRDTVPLLRVGFY